MSYELNLSISTLEEIYAALGGKELLKENASPGPIEPQDAFSQARTDCSNRVKELHDAIGRMDELRIANPNSPDVAHQGQTIRTLLKDLSAAKDNLANLAIDDLPKNKNKWKDDDKEIYDNRMKVVDLVEQHFLECQKLYRSSYLGNKLVQGIEQSKDVASGASVAAGTRVVASNLPEIDCSVEEGFALMKKQDEEIDSKLDVISEKLGHIKQQQLAIGEEMDLQSVMISAISDKIDVVSGEIQSQNAALKQTLKKMKKADKMCCYIVLAVIILALIVFFVK